MPYHARREDELDEFSLALRLTILPSISHRTVANITNHLRIVEQDTYLHEQDSAHPTLETPPKKSLPAPFQVSFKTPYNAHLPCSAVSRQDWPFLPHGHHRLVPK